MRTSISLHHGGSHGIRPTSPHGQHLKGDVALRQPLRITLLLACASLLFVLPAVESAEPPLPVYIQSDTLERQPSRNFLRFRGAVDIKYGDTHITADVVEVNTETGDSTADGNVHIEEPKRQMAGERAEFNLFSHAGTLYHATGSLQEKIPTTQKGGRGGLPQQVTFYLTGERVVRESEDHWQVHAGSLTSCVGSSPVWQLKIRDASIDTESYARLRDVTFWIRNVPVFYTPYLRFPMMTERATGFLPPVYGFSALQGLFLENSFFWAINDQSDSTIGVDYLERRGIRPNLEYRYALSPTDHGQFNGLFLDDRVTGNQYWKLYGTSLQALPDQVQGMLTLDLQSRENYDRIFSVTDPYLVTRREADSSLSLTRNWENVALRLQGQRSIDVANLGDEQLDHYPDVSMHYLPTQLPWAPMEFNMNASATNFLFERTAALGGDLNEQRLNLQPQLAWTYTGLPWVRVTPFFGVQETLFNQGGQGGGEAAVQSVPSLGAEVRGPQLYRIYGEDSATRYKHILEPSLTYTWIPPFTEKTLRQPFDLIDDVFPRNDVAINLTNRILARTQDGDVRELALLSISQGLDLTGQAGAQFTSIAPGPFFADLNLLARVELPSQVTLSGNAAYNYDLRRFDIANTQLSMHPLSFLTFSIDRRFRRDPDINFMNGNVGVNLPGGWDVTYSTGINVRDKSFAGNTVTAAYKPQCWNVLFQLTQRQQSDTRFTFQIGFDGWMSPRVGR